jgi:hypothetical protein
MGRPSDTQAERKIRTRRNVSLYVHFRDCLNQVMETNRSAFWENENIRCHLQKVVWNSVSDGQFAKYSNTANCSAIFSTKVAHSLITKKIDTFQHCKTRSLFWHCEVIYVAMFTSLINETLPPKKFKLLPLLLYSAEEGDAAVWKRRNKNVVVQVNRVLQTHIFRNTDDL